MKKQSEILKQQQAEKRKRSEMLKQESARDINQRFRDGTLWDKTKIKK